MKKTTKKPKQCTEFEMDLTDYVTGDTTFLTKEREAKLFEHLRQCKTCRQDLFDWEEVFGAIVTKLHHDKPETKQKLAELRQRIKQEFLPSKVRGTITKAKVGFVAGDIRDFLIKNGPVSLPDLSDKMNLDPYLAVLSTGWLMREDKINIDQSKIPPVVDANEKEKQVQMGV
ncbi:MAG: winged helix-turn-helix domain-containing protein [Planctomycetota bacterium]